MSRLTCMRAARARWNVAFNSLTIVALAAASGCSGEDSAAGRVPVFPVQGSITFRGQPIPGAVVTLHPKAPAEGVPAPRAQIGKDGTLKVSTYDGGDGAPAGEYVVTVQWYRLVGSGNDVVAGPNVVPPKYASAASSDLIVTVAEAGANSFDLKL
jgi:hypothetical protein